MMSTLVQWLETLWQEFNVSKEVRDPWLWFGFGAQGLFFARFLWQWIVSEKRGHSTIPIAFWYLSLAGGVGTFIYAWYRRELVFMAGQVVACAIYLRNLTLIYGQARRRRLAGLPRVKLRSEVSGENEVQGE